MSAWGRTPSMSKRLLIVAHAPSENTLSLREAVERGARSETGIDVRVIPPLQAGPDDVLAAQRAQLRVLIRAHPGCPGKLAAVEALPDFDQGVDPENSFHRGDVVGVGSRWDLERSPN